MEGQGADTSEFWGTIWSFLVIYGIWVAILFLIILGFIALAMWPRKEKPGENIS